MHAIVLWDGCCYWVAKASLWFNESCWHSLGDPNLKLRTITIGFPLWKCFVPGCIWEGPGSGFESSSTSRQDRQHRRWQAIQHYPMTHPIAVQMHLQFSYCHHDLIGHSTTLHKHTAPNLHTKSQTFQLWSDQEIMHVGLASPARAMGWLTNSQADRQADSQVDGHEGRRAAKPQAIGQAGSRAGIML